MFFDVAYVQEHRAYSFCIQYTSSDIIQTSKNIFSAADISKCQRKMKNWI